MNSEEKIIEIVAIVYRTCDITDVPIDCQGIIETLGYDLIPYSCLSYGKRKACRKISEDAFTAGGAIYYNDSEDFYTRIRFSLMHELGHLLLGHTADDPFREQEADTFASWMLVPRVDLELCSAMDVSVIAGRYDISLAAARHIINNYDSWLSRSKYALYQSERSLFEQLSIEKKRAAKKAEDWHRILCGASAPNELGPMMSPWTRHRLKLKPFIPKSNTMRGKIMEIRHHREYLREIADYYNIDFNELLLEQQRVNHYCSS